MAMTVMQQTIMATLKLAYFCEYTDKIPVADMEI